MTCAGRRMEQDGSFAVNTALAELLVLVHVLGNGQGGEQFEERTYTPPDERDVATTMEDGRRLIALAREVELAEDDIDPTAHYYVSLRESKAPRSMDRRRAGASSTAATTAAVSRIIRGGTGHPARPA